MDVSRQTPWVTAPVPDQLLLQGQRADLRSSEEFRSVFLTVDSIPQATGSTYAEIGNTKLMVAIYGPRTSSRKTAFSENGRLQVYVKYASFATQVRSAAAGQTTKERDMSSLLSRALEPSVQFHTFPKAVVDVYVTILQSGGSDLAVSISASSVALAMAGVALYDLVPACRVGVVAGELLLDPSLAEEASEEAGMVLAQMPNVGEVTQFVLQGRWTQEQSSAALDLCKAGCKQLDAAMRECISDHFAK
uniref:Uncharacterized protein n=1 Tax=Tetraselmis chuii TaxID=63592 RepID=A0A7S1X380_9CHLO|mmetsp:Transcript_26143/g.46493  ORF Transcript_26143/g.46493 Transcript_26143/m.46493 type:complete len:248 (+) Transcript_26143:260-1003(+)|eukprot:CAMPEP_0177752062 /NCGR_PEP_ID=MMETSP0491_2-20121128/717_1 /TAXON_ID=63592 /ORGANISM="Tetraselmis chuii, Strain PLY429" /LENGTH=247 /DNA_ID=CAMNT_0019267237 /DNA_START=186 /DNA_END=929 /DNA_ORIENTATION=-